MHPATFMGHVDKREKTQMIRPEMRQREKDREREGEMVQEKYKYSLLIHIHSYMAINI